MGAPSVTQDELHPDVLPLQSAFTGCNSVLQSTAAAAAAFCCCCCRATVEDLASPTSVCASPGAGIKFAVIVTCSIPSWCCFKLFRIKVPCAND